VTCVVALDAASELVPYMRADDRPVRERPSAHSRRRGAGAPDLAACAVIEDTDVGPVLFKGGRHVMVE
jgi:hypothetical protein